MYKVAQKQRPEGLSLLLGIWSSDPQNVFRSVPGQSLVREYVKIIEIDDHFFKWTFIFYSFNMRGSHPL